jgi:chorismate synthase
VTRLRYLTAGESHGPGLVGILEGLPAGLPLESEEIDRDLVRRQRGYGRGGRMKIEQDAAEIISGVRFGKTLGSPVALLIRNRDFASWTTRMQASAGGPDPRPVTVPRPGHADLAGGLKYGHVDDLRNVLERASARETAMRVALGAIARVLLRDLGIQVGSWVRSIGSAEGLPPQGAAAHLHREDAEGLALLADQTETRALDEESSRRFIEAIDEARRRRDTIGGIIEVVATHVPLGLGSHVQWDRKLDGRLARALMSIPAIKAVEIGDGWAGAHRYGSETHDSILLSGGALARATNRAGGLEGGITNGEPLVCRLAMKPLATVPAALPSVDVSNLVPTPAHVERSDTCAVPAAGVIAESIVALTLADALLEALGGDTMSSLRLPAARLRLSTRTSVGHVFLIGPMGSGKTSAGLALARRLNRPFVDLDGRIEARAGASIAQIFEKNGEQSFRELEAKTLAEAAGEAAAVIALGGGAIQNEAAWRLMRRAGIALALRAAPEESIRRIRSSERPIEARPLLSGADPVAALRKLSAARERYYARADLDLDTTGLDAEAVAAAAVGLIRSASGPFAAGRPAQADHRGAAAPEGEA